MVAEIGEGFIPVGQVVGLAGAPVVVGLTALVRQVWPGLPGRYRPLVAIGWALLLNIGAPVVLGQSVVGALLTRVVTGLVASGRYSQGRVLLAHRAGRSSEDSGRLAAG